VNSDHRRHKRGHPCLAQNPDSGVLHLAAQALYAAFPSMHPKHAETATLEPHWRTSNYQTVRLSMVRCQLIVARSARSKQQVLVKVSVGCSKQIFACANHQAEPTFEVLPQNCLDGI
jgi:hypothetical protein